MIFKLSGVTDQSGTCAYYFIYTKTILLPVNKKLHINDFRKANNALLRLDDEVIINCHLVSESYSASTQVNVCTRILARF